MTKHQEYLHIIYWQMMVIHFNDPPTHAGALHITTKVCLVMYKCFVKQTMPKYGG